MSSLEKVVQSLTLSSTMLTAFHNLGKRKKERDVYNLNKPEMGT